jgi:hypothetical protein
MEIQDLPKATGKSNPSGMSSELLLLPVEWIASIPAPPVWAAPGDSLKIDGDITVNDPLTQGFIKVYVTAKTARLLMEMVGQEDSRSMNITFEFKRPGFDAGFLEMLLEDKDWIFACRNPDCNDNTRYIIGAPCNPAKLGGSNDSNLLGQADAQKGWSGMMSYYGTDIRTIDESVNELPMLPTP